MGGQLLSVSCRCSDLTVADKFCWTQKILNCPISQDNIVTMALPLILQDIMYTDDPNFDSTYTMAC